jgi:tetratricopeptide (TPR) repeat protein
MTKTTARIGRAIPSLLACSLTLGLGVGVLAPATAVAEPDGGVREADRHFQRGVALYVEADYRGALVEFERAYTLAPNGIVLFNVGETQYQLRDYAAALATFEHYLVEAPSNDSHRSLAEANIKELRTRVGRLRIVTVPAGAEISIDDKVVGQTPFEKSIVVGIGQLSVRATMPGRPPVVRTVDVAAEDDVPLTIEMPEPAATSGRNADSPVQLTLTDHPPATPKDYAAWRTAGWVATGVLAGGAITFGILADKASKDLQSARNVFPANAKTLNDNATRTRNLSIVADSLAAGAVVIGAITLFATVNARGESHSGQVVLGPSSVGYHMQF